jgi:hypothetical protein
MIELGGRRCGGESADSGESGSSGNGGTSKEGASGNFGEAGFAREGRFICCAHDMVLLFEFRESHSLLLRLFRIGAVDFPCCVEYALEADTDLPMTRFFLGLP